MEPCVLPSAGTELLDVLICDLLFDLNSASVPESGQLWPILKMKELPFTIRTDPSPLPESARGRVRERSGLDLPIVLDVEVLCVGDGCVDGIVEALRRRDFVVRRPRTLLDDRLVYVAPGMGPVRWTGRRAATTDERAAVILTVQPKNVASTCQTHRQPLYQRRLVR